jgi:hypothetical protein
MAGSSFSLQSPFIQTREDALRHVSQLAARLKKVALVGITVGVACGVMAMLLGRILVNPGAQSSTMPGFQEMSGITLVAAFMAGALIVFSSLYLLAGWGLSQHKPWARYAGAATFFAKLLLCVWLGRGSLRAMILFLLVAGLDLYGLWVLLARETGQLFASPATSQPNAKPANLVT